MAVVIDVNQIEYEMITEEAKDITTKSRLGRLKISFMTRPYQTRISPMRNVGMRLRLMCFVETRN
jgi:hypothetical protein